jgi:hypothetical protein
MPRIIAMPALEKLGIDWPHSLLARNAPRQKWPSPANIRFA